MKNYTAKNVINGKGAMVANRKITAADVESLFPFH